MNQSYIYVCIYFYIYISPLLSLSLSIPLEEGMATHSSILTWRIPLDRGAGQSVVHGVT